MSAPRHWGPWSFCEGVISYLNRAISYQEAADLYALFGERQKAASEAGDLDGAAEAFSAGSEAFCALIAADLYELTAHIRAARLAGAA